MKKLYSFLLVSLGLMTAAHANPGDTTWVQANHVNLDTYASNYDTSIAFPSGSTSYRKVLMYFTLGEHTCPAGSQYCHQWDYTVLNYVITTAGDTVELSRLITPYATSGGPRFTSTWQQVYIFDVTDFYPLLKNTAISRIFFSGYSGGFNADIKYAFIAGTPDRNVTGVSKFYTGYFNYGKASDPINNHLPVLTKTAPVGTQAAAFRFLVTGHGSDTINQCCEFDAHSYSLYLNGTSIVNESIWRADCGLNELYPQGGTWIFNRSNWCPGAMVYPLYHNLPGITAGSTFSINVKFADYTAYSFTPGYGGYQTEASVIYYGAMNKTLDASLEDIIAPSNFADHFRENPSSDLPTIKIHNSGSTAISSVQFQYGVVDSALQQYTWVGALAPLADTVIPLASLATLSNMSKASMTGTYKFIVQILKVNGQTDNDATNDTLRSNFVVAPNWPGNIVMKMKTTNITSGAYLNRDPSEASWTITDMSGNVVSSRTNTTHSTVYSDTLAVPAPGFYKFTVSSAGCDGLSWWEYNYNGSPVVPGYVTINTLSGTTIPMSNYYYTGEFNNDFGCSFSQYFSVTTAGNWVATAIHDPKFAAYNLSVYPNPANDVINVVVSGNLKNDADIQLVNILGQTVYSKATHNQNNISIPTTGMSNGMYTLIYNNGGNRRVEKVVIAK
jgi:hypothetical protein